MAITPEYAAQLQDIASKFGIDPEAFVKAAEINGDKFQVNADEAKRWGVRDVNDPVQTAIATAKGWSQEIKPALWQQIGREPTWGEVAIAQQDGVDTVAKAFKAQNVPIPVQDRLNKFGSGADAQAIPGQAISSPDQQASTQFTNDIAQLEQYAKGQPVVKTGDTLGATTVDPNAPDHRASPLSVFTPVDLKQPTLKIGLINPGEMWKADDAKLQAVGPDDPYYTDAQTELATRKGWSSKSFVQNLTDPAFVSRQAKTYGLQAAAGGLALPAIAPQLAGAVMAGPEAVERKIGLIPQDAPSPSLALEKFGGQLNEDANQIVGTGNPQDTGQSLARNIIGGASPGGLLRKALTIGSATAVGDFMGKVLGTQDPEYKSLLDTIVPQAEAAPPKPTIYDKTTNSNIEMPTAHDLRNKQTVIDWFSAHPGVTPPAQYQNILDGAKGVIPGKTKGTTAIPLNTPAQIPSMSTNYPWNTPFGQTPPPQIIDMPDGSTRNAEDLAAYAKLGGATVAVAVFPMLAKSLLKGLIPVIRPTTRIIDKSGSVAFPSTVTMDTVGDYVKTVGIDANAAAKAQAARSGMPIDRLHVITDNFDLDTRNNGRLQADQALTTGKLSNSAGQFNVNTSVGNIIQAAKTMGATAWTDLSKYLLLHDTVDTINSTGAQRVRGITLGGARQQITVLERAYPQFQEIKKAVAENIAAIRDYAGQGMFAIIDPTTLGNLQTNFKNWVPSFIDVGGKDLVQRAAATLKEPMKVKDTPLGERTSIPTRVEQGHPLDALGNILHNTFMQRMQNEVTGQFIDAMRASPIGRRTFVQVTDDWVKSHPNANTVSIYRNGVKEIYNSSQLLSDVLKFDPLHMWNGPLSALASFPRKVFEFAGTGYGNLTFGFRVAQRDVQAAKVTLPQEYTKPTRTGAILAIPAAITSEMMRSAKQNIDSALRFGTNDFFTGLLGNVDRAKGLPQGTSANEFTNWLGYHYNRSLQSILVNSGSYSIAKTMDTINNGASVFKKIAGSNLTPAPIKAVMNSWATIADSMRNGAAHSAFVRNLRPNMTPDEYRALVNQVHQMGGDNSKVGQSYVYDKQGRKVTMGLDPVGRDPFTFVGTLLAKPLAAGSEVGRMIIPWGNPTVQSMANMAKAYWANPVNFTARLWAHVGAPAAASYLWARSQGQQYVEHMMERRSDYDRTMNMYVAIPGLPPDRGIDIPVWQEGAMMMRLMQVGLDHFFRPTKQADGLEHDFLTAGQAWLKNVVVPPDPSTVAVWQAASDKSFPSPLDPPDKLPQSIEKVARALGAGLGSALGAGYTAFVEDHGSLLDKIKSGVQETNFQTGKSVPIFANLSGNHPLTGSTQIQGEFYQKASAIREFVDIYRFWDINGGRLNVKDASKAGGKAAGDVGVIKDEYPGAVPPAPTNPLYIDFATIMYTKFGHDGDGYQTKLGRYSDLTNAEKSIKNLTYGNLRDWQTRLNEIPAMKEIIDEAGVDVSKPVTRLDANKVLNLYEKKRQDLAKSILLQVHEAEDALSKQVGKKLTINDLHPYQ